MMVIVAVVMVVMMPVGADALDMMVMSLLRCTDGPLMTDDLLAITAKETVHIHVVSLNAFDPLDERLDHQGLVVEIAGLDELDLGMASSVCS